MQTTTARPSSPRIPPGSRVHTLSLIHISQRVDADGLHRVALAVRQGGNARNVIDDIKLFLLKQGFHALFIADIDVYKRQHLPSHWFSCGQTRPQTAGSALDFAMTW